MNITCCLKKYQQTTQHTKNGVNVAVAPTPTPPTTNTPKPADLNVSNAGRFCAIVHYIY